jgi:hypothetical protein
MKLLSVYVQPLVYDRIREYSEKSNSSISSIVGRSLNVYRDVDEREWKQYLKGVSSSVELTTLCTHCNKAILARDSEMLGSDSAFFHIQCLQRLFDHMKRKGQIS